MYVVSLILGPGTKAIVREVSGLSVKEIHLLIYSIYQWDRGELGLSLGVEMLASAIFVPYDFVVQVRNMWTQLLKSHKLVLRPFSSSALLKPWMCPALNTLPQPL